MVFQWPWGTDPTNRSPRGQRPRSLTKLVLVAVSSINTNLAGSSRPCLRIQRRRARATSTRSCSVARRLFFDGDIMSLEKSPDRGATAWNSLLAHRRNDLVQGQIRLFGYQSQQPFHVLLQRRRAPAAQLCSGASSVTPALQPPHRRTGAQAEAFGRFPPRCPGRDGFDHAFPQVIRIGLWHRFGPPNPESMPQDSLTHTQLGIPDSTPPESALVGYGVSLMGGVEAPARGLIAGRSTPDHQHCSPRANGYPRLAHHRPIQSVYWHCPKAPHECIGAATRKRCAR